jgi:hypothetical protein
MNIPSAVRNYWGALWQQTLEGIGGQVTDKQEGDYLAPQAYNAYSMGEGKVWAKGAILEWSGSLYGVEKISDMSLRMQMIRKFEAIEGKVDEKNFGSQFSRTFLKDLASMSMFYSPRRFMEVEAGLQLFGSMMHHQQVEITKDGTTRFIPYIEAWELGQDGIMKLKDGIDKGWDLGGEKFNAFVNRVHETSNQLAGAFAKFSQPAAQRNFAYRLWAFMRRWMTTMFMARWAPERYNFGLANTYEGFYITFLKTLGKIFRSYGKYAMLMKPKERLAIAKVLTEFALTTACWFLKVALFGFLFDDEDEDKIDFDKVRAWKRADPVDSWMGLHLLKLTMSTANENTAFIPWPGYGMDDYINATNISSIALGPTIQGYGELLLNMYYATTGDKKGFYERKVGPYDWQEKGDPKFFNNAAKVFGLSGTDFDPEYGLKQTTTTENKIR